MFAALDALPPDALLGITKLYKEDARASKIDLGVGVFKTPENLTPVLRAVKQAQTRILERETTKVYLPADGAPGFGEAVRTLIFGAAPADRIVMVQTPGGCGALRVGAELLVRSGARRILAGDPTWANHRPLLSAAGLAFESAPFYDAASGGVRFDAFQDAASRLGSGDALLVHGCCHNPTGADLSHEEIDAIVDLAGRRGFLLFIDLAYQGFGESLEADAYFARAALQRLPEALVAYSCSKNFGLYRERTGALAMVGQDAERATRAVAASGLPTRLAHVRAEPFDADRLVAHMGQDKKAEGGRLTFILARALGEAFVAKDVDPAAVRAFLVEEGARS